MNADLSKGLEAVLALSYEQAIYIDKLESLIKELWDGSNYVRDALDEMEAAIVGQGLGSILNHCIGGEAILTYAKNIKGVHDR